MAPLEADTEDGKASDHKLVFMKPLNAIDDKKKVESKTIETRKYSEENFAAMGRVLEDFDWSFFKGILSTKGRVQK